MKKFYHYCTAAILGLCAVGFTACSSDEPSNDENDGNTENGSGNGQEEPGGSTDSFTPEESKEYLEKVAKEFMNRFNPGEQKQLVELSQYFVDEYGDLDLPAGWTDDDFLGKTEPKYSPSRVMKAVGHAMQGNYSGLTRALSETYDFDRYAGIYEPGYEQWKRTGDSDKIIFRFTDAHGAKCELTAAKGTGTWDANDFMDDEDEYRYVIPQNVTVTLTQGGKNMLNGTIKTSPNRSNHTLQASYDITAANIHTTATLKGTDSKVTLNTDIAVNGSTVITGSVECQGHDLCNWNVLQDVDDPADLMSTGNAKLDILGKVQAKASATDLDKIADIIDRYYDNDEYSSENEAKAACQKDCDALNKYMKGTVYYGNNTPQASLFFMPAYYSENYGWGYSWWEWSIETALRFPDDTTYSFDQYFGGDKFVSVQNLFEDLLDSYSRLWK